jgi:signal transduction histidine kinase
VLGLLAALGVAGLIVVALRAARASRGKGREIEALRARMHRLTEDLERSRAESEEAYLQLQGTQAELVSSARLATLGNLIRGVAHEINTPLGALSSNYDVTRRALGRLQVILEDEVVDEDELVEVRKIVKAVDGVQETNAMAVERMKKLVQSLRTFGRPDRSEIDRIDLHEALESTLRLLSHELAGRIEVEKEFGELPPVECYGHQVNQVFMNLLVNAAQAIPGEGTVTIRTRVEGDRSPWRFHCGCPGSSAQKRRTLRKRGVGGHGRGRTSPQTNGRVVS